MSGNFAAHCRWPIVLAAVAAVGGTRLAGQPARAPPTAEGQRAPGGVRPAGAPVVLGTDTLFRLYGTLGPFGPAARAAAVRARLEEFAAAISDRTDSIAVVDADTHTDLVVRDVVIMTVLDADATPLGAPRLAVARRYAGVAHASVIALTKANGWRAFAWAAASAALATLLLAALIWLVSLASRRGTQRLTAMRGTSVRAIRIQRFELISADAIIDALTVALRIVRLALVVLLFYAYVPLVLSFFPWTAGLSRRIVGYAVSPFAAAGRAVLNFLPDLFYLAVIAILARIVLKFVHALFRAVESGRVEFAGFRREWSEPTYKIARFVLLAFAVVVAFPYLPGAQSDAFKGVSIFLGVLFSLGSTSAVSNIVAGTVLTYTSAFKIGERVQIGDTVGDVVERTLLVTRVRTIKNVEVTIPNATVLADRVSNFSSPAAGTGLILHTTVTIGYDAPWRKVHELLGAAARRTEHLLAEPAPFVWQTNLDDFYVHYELNVYTDQPRLMAQTYARLHANIQDTFNEGGVEIASPHFQALRDANAPAMPAPYADRVPRMPGFRVHGVGLEGAGGVPPAGNGVTDPLGPSTATGRL